jgi:cytoskeletal protein CcmA (bactofilin family)
MQGTSTIGPTITVTGDITSDEPLTIAGRVDGTVRVGGHALTIEAGGQLHADIQADSIVVAGQATGSLEAVTRLALESTAVVEGTLMSPVLRMADGDEFRGRLEIAGARGVAALKLAS